MKLSKDQQSVIDLLKNGGIFHFNDARGWVSKDGFSIKVLKRTVNALIVKRVIKKVNTDKNITIYELNPTIKL